MAGEEQHMDHSTQIYESSLSNVSCDSVGSDISYEDVGRRPVEDIGLSVLQADQYTEVNKSSHIMINRNASRGCRCR